MAASRRFQQLGNAFPRSSRQKTATPGLRNQRTRRAGTSYYQAESEFIFLVVDTKVRRLEPTQANPKTNEFLLLTAQGSAPPALSSAIVNVFTDQTGEIIVDNLSEPDFSLSLAYTPYRSICWAGSLTTPIRRTF